MTKELFDRLTRWTKASIFLPKRDPWLTSVLQGVGRLDVTLIGQTPLIEENFRRQQMIPPRVSDAEIVQFADYVYQNFLWVLAGYEFIRTLDQICREETGISVTRKDSINASKRQMERVRIPLAKLEVADRFPDDSRIAVPGWQPGKGAGWLVNESTVILRIDLSDAMLSALETG